jgi:hypothetical protein
MTCFRAIKLGDKVRDQITGFEGIAVARTERFDGSVTIRVQPQRGARRAMHGSVEQDFDELHLEVVEPEGPVAA